MHMYRSMSNASSSESPAHFTDDATSSHVTGSADVDDSVDALLAQHTDEEILDELIRRREIFKCECGTVFRDSALYHLHLSFHKQEDPKKCSACDYSSKDWYDFMSHFFVHKNSGK